MDFNPRLRASRELVSGDITKTGWQVLGNPNVDTVASAFKRSHVAPNAKAFRMLSVDVFAASMVAKEEVMMFSISPGVAAWAYSGFWYSLSGTENASFKDDMPLHKT